MSIHLLEAIKQGNIVSVNALLQDPNQHNPNFEGSPHEGLIEEGIAAIPLHIATHLGHLEIVKLLLNYGAKVNKQDFSGETALHLAVRSWNYELVKELIKVGAEANIECTNNSWSESSLFHECLTTLSEINAQRQPLSEEQVDILSFLYYQKILAEFSLLIAENNIKGAREFIEQSHELSFKYSDELVLTFKIHPNNFNINYGIPLLEASILDTDDMMEMLVEKGANLMIEDENGWTALHHAARLGRTKNVEWLIDQGLDVNIKDIKGNTALHIATEHEQFSTIECLLACYKTKQALLNNDNKPAEALAPTVAIKQLFSMYENSNIPSLMWMCANETAKHPLLIEGLNDHIKSLVVIAKTGTGVEEEQKENIEHNLCYRRNTFP